MCPACLASAALIAGSVISSSGFAALIVRIRSKMAVNRIQSQNLSKESDS